MNKLIPFTILAFLILANNEVYAYDSWKSARAGFGRGSSEFSACSDSQNNARMNAETICRDRGQHVVFHETVKNWVMPSGNDFTCQVQVHFECKN